MAHYVDGFVLPVPKRNLDAYRRMARKAGKVWREHGALEYRECVADDVKVGKVTSFPQSVKRKRDEAVVFAWIVFKSRAHRVFTAVVRDISERRRIERRSRQLQRQLANAQRLAQVGSWEWESRPRTSGRHRGRTSTIGRVSA